MLVFTTIGLAFTLTLVGPGVFAVGPMDQDMGPQASEPSTAATAPSTSSNCVKIGEQLKSEPQNQIIGRDSCEDLKNGDAMITSKPIVNDSMTVQSLISKKVEESIKDYQAAFHAGYEYGIFSAQLGDQFVPGTPKPTTFSQGYEEGYRQGYQGYKTIVKKLQQAEGPK